MVGLGSALESAISGIVAQSTRLSVSAHNVANMQTDEFRASRTVLEAKGGGGVEARVETVDARGPTIVEPNGERREASNVSLEYEIGQQILAEHGLRASVRTLRVISESLGSILDLHV